MWLVDPCAMHSNQLNWSDFLWLQDPFVSVHYSEETIHRSAVCCFFVSLCNTLHFALNKSVFAICYWPAIKCKYVCACVRVCRSHTVNSLALSPNLFPFADNLLDMFLAFGWIIVFVSVYVSVCACVHVSALAPSLFRSQYTAVRSSFLINLFLFGFIICMAVVILLICFAIIFLSLIRKDFFSIPIALDIFNLNLIAQILNSYWHYWRFNWMGGGDSIS